MTISDSRVYEFSSSCFFFFFFRFEALHGILCAIGYATAECMSIAVAVSCMFLQHLYWNFSFNEIRTLLKPFPILVLSKVQALYFLRHWSSLIFLRIRPFHAVIAHSSITAAQFNTFMNTTTILDNQKCTEVKSKWQTLSIWTSQKNVSSRLFGVCDATDPDVHIKTSHALAKLTI